MVDLWLIHLPIETREHSSVVHARVELHQNRSPNDALEEIRGLVLFCRGLHGSLVLERGHLHTLDFLSWVSISSRSFPVG